ncbi:MAG: cysteine desulfurase NifS [Oscillospiraceae bacterium]|nr:cysteine desulfurase NifS [Oscillospiraceae bacterium]
MEKRFIYADNAATTAVSKRVLDAMLPCMTEHFGNPSSIYKLGRDAERAITDAREKVAKAIGCSASEIYFTSGGSEADNWAIRSAAIRLGKKGKKHIITTNFEHHAVLHTCEFLEKQGFEVTYLPVDENGLITAEQVRDAIREDTAIVSIMYANNEIGTIMPIKEIGEVCREKKVLFHTDAVQAVGNVPINVAEQNIDMLSCSGHKIHAQKGTGFLYIRKGIPIVNLIFGGGQERGRRAGTENVPAIVGLGEAITAACENIPAKIAKVSAMRDRLIDGITKIPCSRLNGDRKQRLCGNVNISFLGVEGESLLLLLDANGICASSGSACTSGSLDPSHVLLALGLPHEVAHGSMRLSISEDTTDEDVDYILEVVPKVVERIRAMSPLWEDIQNGKENVQKPLKFVSPLN